MRFSSNHTETKVLCGIALSEIEKAILKKYEQSKKRRVR